MIGFVVRQQKLPMIGRRWYQAVYVSVVSLFACFALAQDGMIYRLEPKTLQEIPGGKLTVVGGTANEKPHRFFLDNLNMLVPISVVLMPENEGERVDIAISKNLWQTPERTGDTRTGPISFSFRTQGEFQISIAALDKPADYRMVVWVGDEVKPVFAPVVVKSSEFSEPIRRESPEEPDHSATAPSKGSELSEPKPGSDRILMPIIAITLIVIAVVLAFIVMRKHP